MNTEQAYTDMKSVAYLFFVRAALKRLKRAEILFETEGGLKFDKVPKEIADILKDCEDQINKYYIEKIGLLNDTYCGEQISKGLKEYASTNIFVDEEEKVHAYYDVRRGLYIADIIDKNNKIIDTVSFTLKQIDQLPREDIKEILKKIFRK